MDPASLNWPPKSRFASVLNKEANAVTDKQKQEAYLKLSIATEVDDSRLGMEDLKRYGALGLPVSDKGPHSAFLPIRPSIPSVFSASYIPLHHNHIYNIGLFALHSAEGSLSRAVELMQRPGQAFSDAWHEHLRAQAWQLARQHVAHLGFPDQWVRQALQDISLFAETKDKGAKKTVSLPSAGDMAVLLVRAS